MQVNEKIQACYKASKNYPELAKALCDIGVESYTVDVATGTLLYRFAGGEQVIHSNAALRQINPGFDLEMTKRSIKANQQGKTTYPQFMEDITVAGVRFYEATLLGSRKRVTYVGSGGQYEELIPI